MSEFILPSLQEVRQYARGALSAAGALEVAPVPIDDIISAVGLHKEDLFAMGEEHLPPRMLALAKKFSGRVLGAMAIKEKVLYVDETLNTPRRRFTQAHELGHQALPWKEDCRQYGRVSLAGRLMSCPVSVLWLLVWICYRQGLSQLLSRAAHGIPSEQVVPR